MVQTLLPEYTPEVRNIYLQTQTGNGQKWLMIEVDTRTKYIMTYSG